MCIRTDVYRTEQVTIAGPCPIPSRVFALWNDHPSWIYMLFLQPGSHGHIPGTSASHVQGLTWDPSCREAQNLPPLPGKGLFCRLEQHAAVCSSRAWTSITLLGRSSSLHSLRHVYHLSFFCASFISSTLLANNAFSCNKAYGAKLSKSSKSEGDPQRKWQL